MGSINASPKIPGAKRMVTLKSTVSGSEKILLNDFRRPGEEILCIIYEYGFVGDRGNTAEETKFGAVEFLFYSSPKFSCNVKLVGKFLRLHLLMNQNKKHVCGNIVCCKKNHYNFGKESVLLIKFIIFRLQIPFVRTAPTDLR